MTAYPFGWAITLFESTLAPVGARTPAGTRRHREDAD